MAFIMLRYAPSIPTFLSVFFYDKWVLYFITCFFICWYDHVIFVFPFVYVKYYIYWFAYIVPSWQSGLETPEKRLEMEDLGRKLRVASEISVWSHPPQVSSHRAQAEHSPLSCSSLRGNNSPNPRRDSARALWYLSLTAESVWDSFEGFWCAVSSGSPFLFWVSIHLVQGT